MSTPDEWAAALKAVKPGAERKALYDRYIASPAWKVKRAEALLRAGNACQLCASSTKQLHVHHRTYERCGNEAPADLTVLCAGCHNMFHSGGKVTRPKRGKRKASKGKSHNAYADVKRVVLERVYVGDSFTTAQVSDWLGKDYSRSVVGARLRRMVRDGYLTRPSKKRWRLRKGNVSEPKPPAEATPATKADLAALAEQLTERLQDDAA